MSTKLVLALDTIPVERITRFEVGMVFKPYIDVYKVSLPFIMNGLKHPKLLQQFLSENKIFFDFKMHDISHQMVESIKSLYAYEPELITVHAVAGPTALKHCCGAVRHDTTKIVGVTVLTSLDQDEWKQVGKGSIKNRVSQYTDLIWDAGLDGVVCDNASARMIKHRYPHAITVVPGFRMGSPEGDQKRTATPETLDVENVDYLVVGRTVTDFSKLKDMSDRLEQISLRLQRP